MELIIKNMSKSYKDIKAVKNINLSLEKGVHALLGANGSGKTTLMKMICGILKGEGEIYLDDIQAFNEYETYASLIGYMPQQFGYYPQYTVKEFLEYMSIVKNLSKQYSEQRITELVKLLNLDDKLNTKMRELSGGMIKRVGIIQALLSEPEILILDEPTAGLDPKERIIFRNLIASLSQKSIILLSTHIVSDIESIADNILIMKEGEIIMQGVYNDLLKIIQGQVWEIVLDKYSAIELMKVSRVVKSHYVDGKIYLRIVSHNQPHKDAKNVTPDLEDLYIFYFGEEAV